MNKFYYEFNENEYYGLITVSVDKDDLYTKPYKKAAEIYAQQIGGESAESVLSEAMPNERTKEFAFMKFAYAHDTLPYTVDKIIKGFEITENSTLLIDGSLI